MDPRTLKSAARVAGLSYLVWAMVGMYNVLYVFPKIVVSGDAVATGANMLAHEFLVKTDIILGQVSIVLTLILMWALYRLFEQVSERQAKLMIALFLVTVPANFVLESFNLASLMMFKGEVLKSFDVAQRQDLAMLFFKLRDYATMVFLTFWGLWLFPMALLVYRSQFLPRFLGIWLTINGFAYLVQSCTSLFWPAYRNMVFNYTMPAMFGELAFAIWLVVSGAKPKHSPVKEGSFEESIRT